MLPVPVRESVPAPVLVTVEFAVVKGELMTTAPVAFVELLTTLRMYSLFVPVVMPLNPPSVIAPVVPPVKRNAPLCTLRVSAPDPETAMVAVVDVLSSHSEFMVWLDPVSVSAVAAEE